MSNIGPVESGLSEIELLMASGNFDGMAMNQITSSARIGVMRDNDAALRSYAQAAQGERKVWAANTF